MVFADLECIFREQIKEWVVGGLELAIGFDAAIEFRHAFFHRLAEIVFQVLQRVDQETQGHRYQRQYQ